MAESGPDVENVAVHIANVQCLRVMLYYRVEKDKMNLAV
jgi:hypothetical protein